VAQRGKYNNMTDEDIAKEERDREEFKKECFEKWRNKIPFTQSDKMCATLRRWDLPGWVVEWERGKQLMWAPIVSWDWE